jgi:hypothetical protein
MRVGPEPARDQSSSLASEVVDVYGDLRFDRH